MPPRTQRHRLKLWTVGCALSVAGVATAWARAESTSSQPADASADRPVPVTSRDIELQYRGEHLTADTLVELWYTRDRGATWQYAGIDDDRRSPLIFHAPADGLYGVLLRLRDKAQPSRPPDRFTPPHRWLLIDATAPLLQWDGVDRIREDGRWVLYLRWTAFDDRFAPRPMALAYQAAGSPKWHPVGPEFANHGRFEWTVPADVTGPLRLRLSARDAAGNVVERTFGPVVLDAAGTEAAAGPASRPVEAPAPASRPAQALPRPVSLERHQRAEELYRRGTWHLERGQYAMAAERFREALDADPDHLAARNDLAGIYYLQRDYPRAIELYTDVLSREAGYAAALRGAALAYVAQKQYPQSRDALQRLLALNDRDAEAWLDLGDVLFLMGKQVEARTHWEKAATIDPAAEVVIDKARKRLQLYAPPKTGGAGATPDR